MTPNVSIIVPVYEGKEYFAELVSDLRNQTLKNIEIILVDDCGSDGAYDVALEAASQDERIVCLRNEKNVGQGICRNKAMDIAKGEYLAFADADDIIPVDFYEKLYTKAKSGNYKVVKGCRVAVFPDGRRQYSILNTDLVSKLMNGKPLHCAFGWEHQTGLFLRSHVDSVGARNAEGRRDQDTAFLLCALFDVTPEEFSLVPGAVYYYRKHDNAVTANINYTYMVELMKSFEFKLNFLKTKKCTEDTMEVVYHEAENRLAVRLCSALQNPVQPEDTKWLEFIQNVRGMLRSFAETNPLTGAKMFTAMALSPSVTDEKLLQQLKKRASSMFFSAFSPKRFIEVDNVAGRGKPVHICMPIKEQSAAQGIVALSSIKAHLTPAETCTAHIVLDRVPQMWIDCLMQLQTDSFKIDLLEEISLLQYQQAHSAMSFENVAKIFLDELLPAVDQVLFCMPQIIAQADLSPLASIDMKQSCIAGVRARSSNAKAVLNAGLQVINLKELRNLDFCSYARQEGCSLLGLANKKADALAFLHMRYDVHLSTLSAAQADIVELNKHYGLAYRDGSELAREAVVMEFPSSLTTCMETRGGVYELWRKYFLLSPVRFLDLLVEPAPKKLALPKPVTVKKHTPPQLSAEEYKRLKKKYKQLRVKAALTWGAPGRRYKEKKQQIGLMLSQTAR